MGHQVGALGNLKQSQTISQPCRLKKNRPCNELHTPRRCFQTVRPIHCSLLPGVAPQRKNPEISYWLVGGAIAISKIIKSMGRIIPYIMEKNVWNHQPVIGVGQKNLAPLASILKYCKRNRPSLKLVKQGRPWDTYRKKSPIYRHR